MRRIDHGRVRCTCSLVLGDDRRAVEDPHDRVAYRDLDVLAHEAVRHGGRLGRGAFSRASRNMVLRARTRALLLDTVARALDLEAP